MAISFTDPRISTVRIPAAQLAAPAQAEEKASHPLDSDQMKDLQRRLMGWFAAERDRQRENREAMEEDARFYDNHQWDDQDAETLKRRGQYPLVFNEIAAPVDWLIGTERRSRVDWNVLPRSEDDVQLAAVKTKVLKYVTDINRTQFARSRAFADCVKVGVGWMDDGARDDPTSDIIYSRYESWRNVLWDSLSYELDLSDARYVFRWRWVDEDIAKAMFPERKEAIERAATGAGGNSDFETLDYDGDEMLFYGSHVSATTDQYGRRRVRLIECQYREPVLSRVAVSGPMQGAFLLPSEDPAGFDTVEKLAHRVHFAVMTEADMLSHGPSVYRHNRYTLTPIWCYRDNKTRLPYGAIRRAKDLQRDLNKRASKALFMLNTNQIIAEENAVEDWNEAREEADAPDGVIRYRKNTQFQLRRDSEAANGQIQLMQLDSQMIQRITGVNNENLGRQTNAVSGKAIEARQLQGSVSTTEAFDNLRYAVQVQGEKLLSLTEQFYSEPKVIRLTGERQKLEWVRINEPEVQADGSVRFLNDITASRADFLVSEQDYAGTLRQVMFENLNQLAGRMQPEAAVRLMIIAMEFSDLPNKDQIAQEIRAAFNLPDPNKELTPEEQQAQAQQQQLQQQQQEMQMRLQQAQIAKLEAEAQRAQSQANAPVNNMEEAMSLARKDADTSLEVARIAADSRIRVAEINQGARHGNPTNPAA